MASLDRPPLDFAIVGVPRAGTTTLYTLLDSHPRLQGTKPKETFFLMDPSHPLNESHPERAANNFHEKGWGGLTRYLPDDGERINFEATTHHYYQDTALRELGSLDPPPTVVIAIRNPAERIRSSFMYTKHNLAYIDDGLSFSEYVDFLLSGETEKIDKFYHSSSSLYNAKNEIKMSKYEKWIDKWIERVGSENTIIVTLEEIKSEEKRAIGRISKAVGFEGEKIDRKKADKNNSKRVKYKWIHRKLRKISKKIKSRKIKKRAKEVYYSIQGEEEEASEEGTEEGVERLRNYFRPHNKELDSKVRPDLSGWY